MSSSFSVSRARMAKSTLALLVIAIGSLTTGASAAPTIASPNTYDLQGWGVQVSFATTSFTGEARFSYTRAGTTLRFSGDQIRAERTRIGTLVTVLISATPDLATTTFTVLIPDVNLGSATSAPVRTEGITTVERTSIGGPALVDGQLQTYRVTPLSGTAQLLFY